MKKFYLAGLALTFLGMGRADITLVTASGSNWYNPVTLPQPLGPSSKNQTASDGPFWNNVSDDGPDCNVGFLLAGLSTSTGGSCANGAQQPGQAPDPDKALPFLGGSSQNSPAPSFYFTPSGGTISVAYISSNAGYTTSSGSTNETFGYATYDPTTGNMGAPVPIFSVSDGKLITDPATTFTTTSDFVFYIQLNPPWPPTSPQTDPAYTSNVSTQFALFSATQSYTQNDFYLGMKDVINGGPGGLSDLDYNDLIVNITDSGPNSSTTTVVASAPEPALYGILALGLAGLITGVRRRKNA